MKIALLQINGIIGDFGYNCSRILKAADEAAAAGCQLAVFSEMVISGYPPQDLLERASFVAAQEEALADLADRLPSIDVIVGAVRRKGDRLYNCALVLRGGRVVHCAAKKLLPAGDIFDQCRWFTPGETTSLYEVEGHCFGVTISDDLWADENGDNSSRHPLADLIACAADNGKQLDGIINISAVPFVAGRDLQWAAASGGCDHNLTLFYCNQVGGHDSLIFDGGSAVISADGRIKGRAQRFGEDCLIYDTVTGSGDKNEQRRRTPPAAMWDALVLGLRDYVTKSGFSAVILGLSGGIDSAVTAAVAVDALGAEQVMAVGMPTPWSSQGSVDDALRLAENLGIRFELIPITRLLATFTEELAPLFAGYDEDVTEQNLQARIRGNLLMALSNKFGSLLLTTGNKSELAVGYCTLYGDMCGGLAVISDLLKGDVYDLARYANRKKEVIPESILTKAPSAELKPGQTDQDDLPAYDTLDAIVALYIEQALGRDDIIAAGFAPEVVDDVLGRIHINEYKRKQAALGLSVRPRAFGSGRRCPSVHNFRG